MAFELFLWVTQYLFVHNYITIQLAHANFFSQSICVLPPYITDRLLLIYFVWNTIFICRSCHMFLLCVHFIYKSYKLPCRKVTKKLKESMKKPRYRVVNRSKNISWLLISNINKWGMCPFLWDLANLAKMRDRHVGGSIFLWNGR